MTPSSIDASGLNPHLESTARFIVEPSRLEGSVRVAGAKNAGLKHLVATILSSGEFVLHNIPTGIGDVQVQIAMLERLGKEVQLDESTVIIRESALSSDLKWNSRSIRNTLIVLGALLARTGEGVVPLPGGCDIGVRPFDIHVDIMRKMGADVWQEGGLLGAKCKASRLRGTQLALRIRSTGATENAILMGCLAIGTTKILNPHVHPGIRDLVALLNQMGAKIVINGQESIVVEGVQRLVGAEHRCIPDDVEALTYLLAAAVCHGDLEIRDFPFCHLETPMIYLRESGLRYFACHDQQTLIVHPSKVYPFDISTGPYPSISSDTQPIFTALGLFGNGESRITELRHPCRFQYVEELRKMGARLQVTGDTLHVHGGHRLHGTCVSAIDLRAGAALVLAALGSDGETTIDRAEQIQRGYENIDEKLRSVGGRIRLDINECQGTG